MKRRRESTYKFMIMAIQNLKPGQSIMFPLIRPKGLVDYINRWGLKAPDVHLCLKRDCVVVYRDSKPFNWEV